MKKKMRTTTANSRAMKATATLAAMMGTTPVEHGCDDGEATHGRVTDEDGARENGEVNGRTTTPVGEAATRWQDGAEFSFVGAASFVFFLLL